MPTLFQQAVWRALMKIPKGSVTTYGAITKYLGSTAVRAVGTAVGKNPDAPVVPCHRVVLSNGNIGNYSGKGGVNTKIVLLSDEGVQVENGKIKAFNEKMYHFNDE